MEGALRSVERSGRVKLGRNIMSASASSRVDFDEELGDVGCVLREDGEGEGEGRMCVERERVCESARSAERVSTLSANRSSYPPL